MPTFNATIKDFVTGDDLDVRRTVTGVPPGQTLAQAWLTIKASPSAPDSAAVIQKVITPVAVDGIGHIEDTGADGSGELLFSLTAEETLLLTPGTDYDYDIQVKTSAGKKYTGEKGKITSVSQVTFAV